MSELGRTRRLCLEVSLSQEGEAVQLCFMRHLVVSFGWF